MPWSPRFSFVVIKEEGRKNAFIYAKEKNWSQMQASNNKDTCCCCSQCRPLACWPAAGPGSLQRCRSSSSPWSCETWPRVWPPCRCAASPRPTSPGSDERDRRRRPGTWVALFHTASKSHFWSDDDDLFLKLLFVFLEAGPKYKQSSFHRGGVF